MRNLLVGIIIVAFAFSIIPVFAQTSTLLTISSTKSIYTEGETIVISGEVSTVIGQTPVTIQLFHKGNLVEVAQLQVANDGTFTKTILAQGPLWKNNGEYTVRASYGQGVVAETTFEFATKQAMVETTDRFEVDAGTSGTFDVEYSIKGGTVKNMLIDPDIYALITVIDSTADGAITLKLPRESIDAKVSMCNGSDDVFIILIDGVEVTYAEKDTNSASRTITINFEEGNSDIEIIGTCVVPEFGAIAALILAVAIISIIAVTSKNSLRMRI